MASSRNETFDDLADGIERRSTLHLGSELLLPLAQHLGLPIDQINFVVCQMVGLVCSNIYHNNVRLHASRSSRLLFPAIVGLTFTLFCFGKTVKHLMISLLVGYCLLIAMPTRYVHGYDDFSLDFCIVFVFAMGYLSYIHFLKMESARTYVLDITGPMMVFTQKVTSLAFEFHDNSKNEQQNGTRSRPSFYEYLSYALNFQTILCGPFCGFDEYLAFVDRTDISDTCRQRSALRTSTETSEVNVDEINAELVTACEVERKKAVLLNVITALLCLGVAIFIVPMWPVRWIVDNEESTIVVKMLYLHWSLLLVRTQYYFGWKISEAVCNMSGLGFSGFNAISGKPEWCLLTNVNIFKFEFGLSFRESVEAWNCSTIKWLRQISYKRLPPAYNTILTYVLSAIWHGYYVGYYLTFITGALFTQSARIVRRNVRPLFQKTAWRRLFYDIATFFAARLAIAYAAFPFVLLSFRASMAVYSSLNYFMHYAAMAVILIPFFTKMQRSIGKKLAPKML